MSPCENWEIEKRYVVSNITIYTLYTTEIRYTEIRYIIFSITIYYYI